MCRRMSTLCVLALALFALTATAARAEFLENFDSYAAGSQMHGQGGWKGWDNSPSAGAVVSTSQAFSAPNSVEITGGSDLVHVFTEATSGTWEFTAKQYVPSTVSGTTYFILLNRYIDGGPDAWSGSWPVFGGSCVKVASRVTVEGRARLFAGVFAAGQGLSSRRLTPSRTACG